MARPPVADWEVLDLTEDPTPGDPEVIDRLVVEYQAVSDDAESAFSVVSRVQAQELGSGKSMEKLKETLSELPNQVGALRDSYEMAAKALKDYAGTLRDHQAKAAEALTKGREAADRLASAIATASAAGAHVSSLDNATPPPPDDEKAKSEARRALDDARNAARDAQGAVDSAQAELDAARQLALDAKALRETDARTAVTKLGEAEDEAVKKKNFWDKLWDSIGSAFGIISAILGVISFLIPGLQGLSIALGIMSLVTGLVPLGINIARGAVTGNWDVVGIVLGTVGAAFGGVALSGAIAAVGKGLQTLVTTGRMPKVNWLGKGPKGNGGPGGAGDDIPLQNLPPLPPSRPGTPLPANPPQVTVNLPGAGFLDDMPHIGNGVFRPGTPPPPPMPTRPPPPPPAPLPPPNIPNLPPSIANNPGAIAAYLQSLKGHSIPGMIGASTAFLGSLYGPTATAGHGGWAVAHGRPLVGNTRTDGT
ncbi:hypothetical protein [Streptomyces sp. NPDC091371]|uniref:hypothetical protein n=1 Tax=Streptomyces sp. NPDC091371 TaxID=3155303 RepID=UPI00341E4D9D